jgi:hypothetical protein
VHENGTTGQSQPFPLAQADASPTGVVSVTVTVPLVAPAAFAAFDTVTVYPARFCPTEKSPVWVMVMLSAVGNEMIVVGSLPFADAEPAPETLTWFVSGEAAFAATFTVVVIAG